MVSVIKYMHTVPRSKLGGGGFNSCLHEKQSCKPHAFD